MEYLFHEKTPYEIINYSLSNIIFDADVVKTCVLWNLRFVIIELFAPLLNSISMSLSKRFKIKKVAYFSPFFELYFLFANTILHFLMLRKKNIRWR